MITEMPTNNHVRQGPLITNTILGLYYPTQQSAVAASTWYSTASQRVAPSPNLDFFMTAVMGASIPLPSSPIFSPSDHLETDKAKNKRSVTAATGHMSLTPFVQAVDSRCCLGKSLRLCAQLPGLPQPCCVHRPRLRRLPSEVSSGSC